MKITLGTRGSPLALLQTRMVAKALRDKNPGVQLEERIITTSGDWQPAQGETRLNAQAGGKGLFVKEIEEALLSHEIDAAVHSLKDVPTFLPTGLCIHHVLAREDVRDTLLVKNEWRGQIKALSDLPAGAVIGTASVRRQALILHARPDVKVVPLRGNVQTRIDKVRTGQVDASFLALAGLRRLGIEREADVILEPDEFLPSPGQGAIGIETRTDDLPLHDVLQKISCFETMRCVTAERAALKMLDGSCHTPIGGWAVLAGDQMSLRVLVAALDGSTLYEQHGTALVENIDSAEKLGVDLGAALKEKIPTGIL